MQYENFKSVPNKKSWVNLAHLYLTFSLFIKYKSGTHNDLFASRPNQYNGVLLQSSPLEIWNPHFHKMPLSTMTHMSILRLIAIYTTSSSPYSCTSFIKYETWSLLERCKIKVKVNYLAHLRFRNSRNQRSSEILKNHRVLETKNFKCIDA